MDIIIAGTGGAGNNTVNYMLDQGIEGRYVAVLGSWKTSAKEPAARRRRSSNWLSANIWKNTETTNKSHSL